MQSVVTPGKQIPVRGLKQVKVDNWGTFFLQRLQQLYFEEELLDLTIKFPTSDITVQVNFIINFNSFLLNQLLSYLKNVILVTKLRVFCRKKMHFFFIF